MARTDTRFRTAFNQLLDLCESFEVNQTLPSESALAEQFNVSRTVIRSALQSLDEQKIISWQGRTKSLIRAPRDEDRLQINDDLISLDELETRFLEWVLRFDVPPGTPLNVTQLARQFSVSPHMLQEFLSGLSRFGLVERRERGGWTLMGFTEEFAIELSDFRAVLELNAVRQLSTLPAAHPIWSQLDRLEEKHRSLLDRIETDYHDFSKLDEDFHTTINNVVKNRFVSEFQKVISLIFHYHYQWDKSSERTRNEAAIREHLFWIDGLRTGDPEKAVAAATVHLKTSKNTLLDSLRVHNFP
ncbi:GntR family transcriptional regulator [Candidatus Halocynthiibacter alkanivorans]|uniref:GntR family transcriptional regulator n=1 Tax=Candidatus Halocynthiibacter alkanivorans TaxID=2267619 RepID=UPI000DF434E3|nr:GntR family transcriptional regulator [Candidatus Halocynthiibacter alkanivorans]